MYCLNGFDSLFSLLRSKCEFTIQAVNKQGRWVLTSSYWSFSSICIFWHSSLKFSLRYLKIHTKLMVSLKACKCVISELKSLFFYFQDHSSDWWRQPLCSKNSTLEKQITFCLTKGWQWNDLCNLQSFFFILTNSTLFSKASMIVHDIPDLQWDGGDLGSVVFSESFLESSINIQQKGTILIRLRLIRMDCW